MSRITWKNITAPQTASSAYAAQAAAELINSGFANLGTGLKEIDASQTAIHDKRAIAKALEFRDNATWDDFLKTQGIAGLGVAPSRLSAGALDTLRNRGIELANVGNTRAVTDNIQSITDERDYGLSRRVLGDRQADALAIAKQEAANWYQQNARKFDSQGALVQAIENDTSLDATTRDLRLAAVQGGPNFWDVSEDAVARSSLLDPVRNFDAAVASDEARRNVEFGTKTGARTFLAANQQYGGIADPVAKIIEDMTALHKDLDQDVISSTAGEIRGTFDKLVKANPGVPLEVIALGVSQSLERDKNLLIFPGDGQRVDRAKAQSVIDTVGDPESLATAQRLAYQYEEDQRLSVENQRQMEQAKGRYQLAVDRDDTAGMQRAIRDMERISLAAFPPAPATFAGGGGDTGNTGQASVPVPAPTPNPHPDLVAPPGVNPTIHRNNQILSQAASDLGRGAMKTIERGGNFAQSILQAPERATAHLLGVVDPEAGTRMLERLDRANQPFSERSQREEPTPNPHPPLHEVSVQDVITTALEIGASPTEMEALGRMAQALKDGTMPSTGKPLTEEQREGFEQALANFDKKARDYYRQLGITPARSRNLR